MKCLMSKLTSKWNDGRQFGSTRMKCTEHCSHYLPFSPSPKTVWVLQPWHPTQDTWGRQQVISHLYSLLWWGGCHTPHRAIRGCTWEQREPVGPASSRHFSNWRVDGVPLTPTGECDWHLNHSTGWQGGEIIRSRTEWGSGGPAGKRPSQQGKLSRHFTCTESKAITGKFPQRQKDLSGDSFEFIYLQSLIFWYNFSSGIKSWWSVQISSAIMNVIDH